MIIVNILGGAPGSGKTTHIMQTMVKTKGQYLFASPRIDLIQERLDDLRRFARAAGTNPVVRAIHSQATDRDNRIPVLGEIAEAHLAHRDDEHVILLVTHEGMMGADLSEYGGWHAYVDESPSAVCSNAMRVPATATYLDEAYDLVRVEGTKWSKLALKPDAPNQSAIMRDEFLRGLAVLDKRARSPQGVYVDIGAWDEVKGSNRLLKWWSVWTPLELAPFASVTVIGSGYRHSLGYRATENWLGDQVRFNSQVMSTPRRAAPRVQIHYFTAAHRGSTSFWKGDGRHCLAAVCRYLEGVSDLGYWSGNEEVRDYLYQRLPGEMVSPKLEGTNSLRNHLSCAFIYSGKALPSDGPLMEVFGLDRSAIERAREIEDIIQFVLRGRLRCPNYGGDYRVYLYDLHQAKALADYLVAEGMAQVDLIPVEEARILDYRRPSKGRKVVEQDERSRAEKQRQRREADTERKRHKRAEERAARLQQGTLRPRGRPRRAA